MASSSLANETNLTTARTESQIATLHVTGTDYTSVQGLGNFLGSKIFRYRDAPYRASLYEDVFEGQPVYYVASITPKAIGSGLTIEEAFRSFMVSFQATLAEKSHPDKSEQRIRFLARNMPGELVRIMEREHLEPSTLSFAAEQLGFSYPFVIPVLEELLHHGSPTVREGAVYGLSKHKNETVFNALQKHQELESSEAVRDAIRECLEDFWD